MYMYTEQAPTVRITVIISAIIRLGAEGLTGTVAMLRTVNEGVRSCSLAFASSNC